MKVELYNYVINFEHALIVQRIIFEIKDFSPCLNSFGILFLGFDV